MRWICFSFLVILLTNCSKTELDLQTALAKQPKSEIEIQTEGRPQKGYLVGIEPYLIQSSYSTDEAFYQSLKVYFDYAKREEVLPVERTVVVLPEYIGTWLVASGEDKSLFEKNTVSDAMEIVVLKNLGRFVWFYLFGNNSSTDSLKETLFRMKAWQMAHSYQTVFSRLAKEYRIAIVAGSIILPEPKVVEGKITVTDGPLQNVSFYFRSDGEVDERVTRKSFPIEDEKSFISGFDPGSNPSILTSLGTLATLVCADSWYPEAYQNASNQSATLLAIPSLLAPADAWDKKWNGYNGGKIPKDVNLKDINQITEWQAWKKYSLLGRAEAHQIKNGMNVFFRGQVWDIIATGDAFLLQNGKPVAVKRKNLKNLGRVYALGI
ncbi:carbon-nitrogen hydrolase family protein [Leptospira ilyithenensis]|uniref:carbon-nitrogen hydrolase family protein n=1 Tax=Leptospira ilyithenensis TaxID=2484901 RepID=UPI001FE8D97C|nr:carbon-nitrogen hydrolase family protein [Leptospira ilyithenensis]